MIHEKSSEVTRSIAIEITPTEATLIEIHSKDALATAVVRAASVTLSEEPLRFSDPEAADLLVDALRPLVQEFSLQGQAVALLLSGEYCSTRVLRGDADTIRRGINDLEKLKNHYMGLGRGEKALSSVVSSVDARQERATIAVAVESTLELLIETAQRLGMELSTVEPTAIGLARLCGYLKVDTAQPVAAVAADACGTDIALSFKGDLLLHQRLHAPLEAAGEYERIRQQLCLLAQYAARFSQNARENNLPVYIVTSGQAETDLATHIDQDSDLEVRTFDAQQSLPEWECDASQDLRSRWAAVGTCLRAFMGQQAAPAPDMVHNLSGTSHLKILQARRKMVFPLVAAGVVGLSVGIAAIWESTAAASLKENLQRFEAVEQELEATKLRLAAAKQFNKSTEVIGKQVSGIDWRRELELLAQCRPDGVWLKRVVLSEKGTLTITGTAEKDAEIYQFEEWLNKAPSFANVKLTSTRPGTRTEFEMECGIRGRGGY